MSKYDTGNPDPIRKGAAMSKQKNGALNEPASPCPELGVFHFSDPGAYKGLTILEHACILLRQPETGIDELDDLIRKARHNEIREKAMQAMIAAPEGMYGTIQVADLEECDTGEWRIDSNGHVFHFQQNRLPKDEKRYKVVTTFVERIAREATEYADAFCGDRRVTLFKVDPESGEMTLARCEKCPFAEGQADAKAMLAARDEAIAQRDALVEALKEARTTLVVTESNILDAEQTDARWKGVPAKIRQRIKDIDAAIANAKGGEAC